MHVLDADLEPSKGLSDVHMQDLALEAGEEAVIVEEESTGFGCPRDTGAFLNLPP